MFTPPDDLLTISPLLFLFLHCETVRFFLNDFIGSFRMPCPWPLSVGHLIRFYQRLFCFPFLFGARLLRDFCFN
uniref:Putative secreted protein n=1 Tax=Anopheles darlingi TaxID=43151 RepID=A0A2M4D6V8_ANODA